MNPASIPSDNTRRIGSSSANIGEPFAAKMVQAPHQSLSLACRYSLGGFARQFRASALLCLAVLSVQWTAHAQLPTPAVPPASPELEARLKTLETELRCLVCQNQTLADSPAGLAGDLRREIRLLADQGKSNDQIKAHLRARYGDFVLYKPEVEPKTWLLWGGPFVLLAGGAIVFFMMNRRRGPATSEPNATASAENERARKLLDGD